LLQRKKERKKERKKQLYTDNLSEFRFF
jgi:hypothetical protein